MSFNYDKKIIPDGCHTTREDPINIPVDEKMVHMMFKNDTERQLQLHLMFNEGYTVGRPFTVKPSEGMDMKVQSNANYKLTDTANNCLGVFRVGSQKSTILASKVIDENKKLSTTKIYKSRAYITITKIYSAEERAGDSSLPQKRTELLEKNTYGPSTKPWNKFKHGITSLHLMPRTKITLTDNEDVLVVKNISDNEFKNIQLKNLPRGKNYFKEPVTPQTYIENNTVDGPTWDSYGTNITVEATLSPKEELELEEIFGKLYEEEAAQRKIDEEEAAQKRIEEEEAAQTLINERNITDEYDLKAPSYDKPKSNTSKRKYIVWGLVGLGVVLILLLIGWLIMRQ